ncbi:MAG TPA: hypothetical protein VIH99_10335 [Bdellovibrionota bacterium]|jgi:hypothetical protein
MKTLFSLLLLSLTAPAYATNGTLEVKSGSLRVQRDDGMKVHFYPGKYAAQFTIANRKAYLYVTRKDILTEAAIQLPSGAQFPENGAVNIDGFRTGQTFAIKGNVSTVRDQTPSRRETESCVYYRTEWVCHGYGYDSWCDWEDIAVPGYREVEFHYLTKTQTLALDLDSRNGGASVFNGRSVDRQKIYTYQGQCY